MNQADCPSLDRPDAVMVRCPRCGSDMWRIQRRIVDRVASWVIPVRRYHCPSLGCGWEGNLRAKARASVAWPPDIGFPRPVSTGSPAAPEGGRTR
jgi:predicted RNA-binding Zn-ribbon protein involved in translation (DUF1610 family)